MKINRHYLLYQNKDNWKREVQMLKAFKIPHEAKILECELEYIHLVDDYEGQPVRQDNLGYDMAWFFKLYKVNYKTKLRILPA